MNVFFITILTLRSCFPNELTKHSLTISTALLSGSLFYKLEIRKLTISNTPVVNIDQHVFQGINETLQEFYLLTSMLSAFPKLAFKVVKNDLQLKV